MSRGRRHSLDHAQPRAQRGPIVSNKVYIPERSYSAPNTYFRHYGGTNKNRSSECLSNVRYLEDFEDPRFSDLPPESSFDEVRCVMTSPPCTSYPVTSTAAKKLDELRSKIAEVIAVGDLRQQMVTHNGPYEVSPQNSPTQIDDNRKRTKAVIVESTTIPPFCPYENSPLPKDSHTIPPSPVDLNDVLVLIKRAKAKTRLKELEEKQSKLEQLKTTLKKDPKNLKARKKLTGKVLTKPKTVPAMINQMTKRQKNKRDAPTSVLKKGLPQNTDVENASKFLKSHNTPLRQISPPAPKIPTYENILQRMSVIRSRTEAAKPVLDGKKRCIVSPRPQEESEELDEFEVLEELYGAAKCDQSPPIQQNISNIRNRINVLQQHLLQSPVPMDSIEKEELDEFEALEQQLEGTSFERPATEYFASDLQDRINALKKHVFQSPTKNQCPVYDLPSILHYDDLQQSKNILPAADTIIRSMQETHANMPRTSAEVLANDGFEVKNDVCLAEITMPDFDGEVSFDEFRIADITSPDFCDLSISAYDLALEPDFEDDQVAEKVETEQISEQRGVLSSAINVIADRLQNDVQSEEEQTNVELDTSLPTIFEAKPSIELNMPKNPKAQTLLERPAPQMPIDSAGRIEVPPYHKDSTDCKAIVKRAQAIQMKKGAGHPSAKDSASSLLKKKVPMQKKARHGKAANVYPLGVYSPSYAKAVARARNLAGLQNLSAALNPQRAAEIAKQKTIKETKLAATEALPVVERMRAKMRRVQRAVSDLSGCYIEDFPTLELSSQKTTDRRTDRCMKSSEALFSLDSDGISSPAENAYNNKNRKGLSVIPPTAKEIEVEADLIYLSPLKPHEGLLRLRYLKDQAAKLAIRTAKENTAEIEDSLISPMQSSPIRLHSPRTEVEVDESAETRTSTGQVATENATYGNIVYNPQKEISCSGDDLDDIEPPEFLNTPPATSIPITNRIIDKIRSKVKENISSALPNIQHSIFPVCPEMVSFPPDLPDEQLLDIKTPEFEKTPGEVSAYLKSISPLEKDVRMYAWGEQPSATLPTQVPTSTQVSPEPSEQARCISCIPSARETICIPPHPKDLKNYRAMIKRAQAIQNIQNQPDIWPDEIAPPEQYLPKRDRVPTSRWAELTPKDSKRRPSKRLLSKKQQPKFSPEKIDTDCLSKLLSLPAKYREAVGLKNRTAALNSALPAKVVENKTDEEAFKALPEIEKLKLKIEYLRKHHTKAQADPNNIVDISQKNLKAQRESEASLDKFGPPRTEYKKLFSFDTPRGSKRHGQRFLIREFLTFPKHTETEPHALVQSSDRSRLKVPPARQNTQDAAPVQKLQVENFQDALAGTIYDDPIQDFRIPAEDVVLETSQLKTEKSPRNTQERFQTLQNLQESKAPEYVYSTVKLISPSGTVCRMPGRVSSPYLLAKEKVFRPIRQFKNVKDVPFEKLEYEVEPPLAHISFGKPLTPPPGPSETINRLKSKLKKIVIQPYAVSSSNILKFPEELPDENLFEQSAPSFAQTPQKYKSKEEGRPVIPITPEHLAACMPMTTKSAIHLPFQEVLEEKLCTPDDSIFIPTPTMDPKNYGAMIRCSREIHKTNEQKKAEKASQPPKSQKNYRLSTYGQVPPSRKISSKSRKLGIRKHLKESEKVQQRTNPRLVEEEKQCPAETPPFPQNYGDAIAKQRLYYGLTSRTDALNPKITAKNASKKSSQEVYDALPEIEEIKGHIEKLRKNHQHRRHPRPTIEKIYYIEALKHTSTPVTIPVRTPETHYTPITLHSSTDEKESKKLPHQVTAELDSVEDLENINEPTYLDISASTPMELPRPRDIINRVRMQFEKRCRPEVPTGHLIELRTPPKMLPLPTELPEEDLLNLSYPNFERTPQSPKRTLNNISPDISIPQLFRPTPTPTPRRQLPSLRQRMSTAACASTYPQDPENFKTMVRRARKSQQQTATQSPKSRYERKNMSLNLEGRSSFGECCYSPIHFESPCISEVKIDVDKNLNSYDPSFVSFKNLDELENLSEIEQSSLMDISKYHTVNDQCLPLTSPHTPPFAPYNEKRAVTSQETAMPTTTKFIEFFKELPEEKLLEQSAPSFSDTPAKLQTPAMTPNISIPQYFKESPPADIIDKNIRHLESPALSEVHLGSKEKASQSKIIAPSHPKDPKNLVAMTKRSQIMQKRLPKKAADKPIKEKAKFATKTVSQNEQKRKTTAPPILQFEYLAAVAKSRKLAGLKNVPTLFRSKGAASTASGAAKVTPHPSSYTTIMEKIFALRTKYKLVAPSTRELAHKQCLINRLQRQERKRLLIESQQLRQQGSEFQSFKTPIPIEERLEAIKSRLTAEVTDSSAHPYSPVKTPELPDFRQFQPLVIPQTPPFPFLENVLINHISDVSMQLDNTNNSTSARETTNEEDLEFELTEIANGAYIFGTQTDVEELDRDKVDFDIYERIQVLRKQLLQSSKEDDED